MNIKSIEWMKKIRIKTKKNGKNISRFKLYAECGFGVTKYIGFVHTHKLAHSNLWHNLYENQYIQYQLSWFHSVLICLQWNNWWIADFQIRYILFVNKCIFHRYKLSLLRGVQSNHWNHPFTLFSNAFIFHQSARVCACARVCFWDGTSAKLNINKLWCKTILPDRTRK